MAILYDDTVIKRESAAGPMRFTSRRFQVILIVDGNYFYF